MRYNFSHFHINQVFVQNIDFHEKFNFRIIFICFQNRWPKVMTLLSSSRKKNEEISSNTYNDIYFPSHEYCFPDHEQPVDSIIWLCFHSASSIIDHQPVSTFISRQLSRCCLLQSFNSIDIYRFNILLRCIGIQILMYGIFNRSCDPLLSSFESFLINMKK